MNRKHLAIIAMWVTACSALMFGAATTLSAQSKGSEVLRIESDSGTYAVFENAQGELTFEFNDEVIQDQRKTESLRREVERIKATAKRQTASSTLRTIIADMEARPSLSPDIVRLETAVIRLAEILDEDF